jgi:predicted membrane protein
MEKKFYTSTNWLPWLGGGFLLSIFLFSYISNWYLLVFLLILVFLPAIAVRLTLKSYFFIEGNKVKLYYDRKEKKDVSVEIPLLQISEVRRVGKSVVIYYGSGNEMSSRIHEAKDFVELMMKYNPQIKLSDE